MDRTQLGQAGLVGWRGRLGRRAADEIGKRTQLDAETLAALIGAYLFVSRARRMWQMLVRARRAV